MVARTLRLPPDGEIEGRPTTLLEALEGSPDRQQRLDAVHAYWRLAGAVAAYHICLDESAQIGRFEVRPQDAAAHRMAHAAATAALRKTELGVVAAQHRLAEAARLPTSGSLPLPADHPHIGPYRTRFDEMFSMQAAPSSARLIDRTIPICRRAIDARALAIHAAEGRPGSGRRCLWGGPRRPGHGRRLPASVGLPVAGHDCVGLPLQ